MGFQDLPFAPSLCCHPVIFWGHPLLLQSGNHDRIVGITNNGRVPSPGKISLASGDFSLYDVSPVLQASYQGGSTISHLAASVSRLTHILFGLTSPSSIGPWAFTYQCFLLCAANHPSSLCPTHHPGPLRQIGHPSPLRQTGHPSPLRSTRLPIPSWLSCFSDLSSYSPGLVAVCYLLARSWLTGQSSLHAHSFRCQFNNHWFGLTCYWHQLHGLR